MNYKKILEQNYSQSNSLSKTLDVVSDGGATLYFSKSNNNQIDIAGMVHIIR